MIELKIGKHDGGQRIDRWLRKAFPQASLSTLFGILRKKKVRVNGKVAKAQQVVAIDDLVQIYENLPESSKSVAPAFQLADHEDPRVVVVWQSEDFVVLDKPAGLASQPGSGQKEGDSLVELLWPWARAQGLDFKPALVHRLDQETSGLIVAALSGDGARGLNQRIRERNFHKEYLALVAGKLPQKQGTIRLALDRTDSAQGAKMQVGSGKESITHYRVEEEFENATLVRVLLETGRMHQIRAHFASIGNPLLGDGRYGDFALNRQIRKEAGLKRLFLHAALLEFEWGGEEHGFEAELPEELKKALAFYQRTR